MIVSFHPIITAHKNIICAGRAPDENDLKAIRAADAVILPQGCNQSLYEMARAHCARVFPNLDARFDHPGKIGQIHLFEKFSVRHPRSQTFPSLRVYAQRGISIDFPLIVKLNWGGQGDTVFPATNPDELKAVMERVAACERSGQKGFLVQEWIPGGERALRVAVIGTHLESYWRVQPVDGCFGTALSKGGCIDPHADPALQTAGREMVCDFSNKTGVQLAGIDLIFDQRRRDQGVIESLMLEINYFFGRQGLGGSERYYQLLEREVDAWLGSHGLQR